MQAWFARLRRRYRLMKIRSQQAISASGRSGKFSQAWWRVRVWQGLALVAVAGLVSAIVGVVVIAVWIARDLPDPNKVRQTNIGSTQIVDRTGQNLYNVTGDEQRTPLKFEEMPEYLRLATIAVEDKDFYKHRGFDPLTPLRIVWNLVTQRRLIGGSTLTQQLVKNALLSNERTVIRKAKEFILAMEIERQYTKDEILQMYLNEAPYGGTAVGVGAASQLYFNKEASQLSLVEAAVLAGLPQRPTAYSPFLNRTTEDGVPLWRWRAEGVLRRMREDGYISPELEKQAVEQLASLVFSKADVSIQAPHFVFFVQDQLDEILGEDAAQAGGYVVRTTLDLPIHQEVQKIVAEEIEKVNALNITNGAAMMMDPQTGEIISMVGSKNYFAEDIPGQYNVAVDGLRQPGSSIKPITYLTALQQGYTPASMFVDSFTSFTPNDQADAYEPNNYDGKFRGPLSLRRALAESNNVVAVKTLAKVGVSNMLKNAYEMGFNTLEPTAENMRRFGLSVTLGGAEVHLIDSVTAYSAFANGGKKIAPVAILEVRTQEGKLLYEHRHVPGRQVIQPEHAFLINDILSDDNARSGAFGTGSQLNIRNLPIAVKTGTTNDQRDNWTVGWSQSAIVGVWVGNNDNSAMKRVASGVTGASPIWRRAMLAALAAGRTAEPWARPEDRVERVAVDAVSGWPAHDDLPSREEWVEKGTLPTSLDPIHKKIKVCRGQNKLASAAEVQRGNAEERLYIDLKETDPISQDGRNRWQEGIDAWVATQPEADKYRVPTEFCGSTEEVVVLIDNPRPETNVAGTDVTVEMRAISDQAISRVELMVNGQVRESFTQPPYRVTINLPAGRYKLKAKATTVNGKTAETGDVAVGTGGTDWREPAPSPTPSPSTVASPSPAPSPTPEDSPDPEI